MDFSKIKTSELIEIYEEIDKFISFLKKEKEIVSQEEN